MWKLIVYLILIWLTGNENMSMPWYVHSAFIIAIVFDFMDAVMDSKPKENNVGKN